METLYTQNHFSSPLSPAALCKSCDLLADTYMNPVQTRSIKNREKLHSRPEESVVSSSPALRKEAKDKEQVVTLSERPKVQVDVRPVRPSSPAVFDAEPELDDREREFFMRCVIIGSQGTGKHSLVDANFPQQAKTAYRGKADFIKRESVRFNTTKKYHFWLKSLGEESTTESIIWNTYYKWANTFVFVYDMTNKESFEALDKAVQKVLQTVPQENFFGVLVGTKSDLYKQAAVDYEDAENFKLKYNFSHFFETNCLETEASQLLPRLNSKLKLTFEAI